MPNRDFDTATWTDPWVETLSPMQKLLFFYLWTNNHCTSAGLYYISVKRISDETGLTVKQVHDLLPALATPKEAPKVMYDETCNLVWVRNFIRKQRRGNKFLISVCNNLAKMKSHPFISMLLEEYKNFNDLAELQEKFNSSSVGTTYSGAVLDLFKKEEVVGEGNNGAGKKLFGSAERLSQEKAYVKLSEAEYLSLCKRFGRKGADDRIEELNSGIGSQGYKYKDHYDTILSWDRKKQGRPVHLADEAIKELRAEIEKRLAYMSEASQEGKPDIAEKQRKTIERKKQVIGLLKSGVWTVDEYQDYLDKVRNQDTEGIRKIFEDIQKLEVSA